MAFEASVQQIQRLMGSNAGAFQQWANKNAAALGMARAEATRYGAVYANLISGFSSSTAEIKQRTQDLLRTSAVVMSYTGRTMEDVMERIRSGLLGNTEAIEDLGINVNVSMIEATDAFQQFANGKSWEQLDFRTQQTIRYFAIMEQAARKYGNELAQNTATRHAAFIAQLKDLQLALGQAFLPIYNVVLPALTQLAASLAEVMRFVAAFLQAFFGYNPHNQAQQIVQQTKAANKQAAAVGGLGDTYEKAGKKARGALASFDEIHQLADTSTGDADSGASVGIDIPFEGINGGVIGDALFSVSEKAQEMAEKLKNTLKGIRDTFVQYKDEMVLALEAIALNMLKTALNTGKLNEAAKLLKENFIKLGEVLKASPIGKWFSEALLPWLKESPLISLFKAIQEGVIKASEVVKTKAAEIAKVLDFSKIFATFRENTIVQKVIAIFSSIQSKIKEFTAFLKDNAIVSFFAEVGNKIAGVAKQVGGKLSEIGAFIARLVAPFRVVWEWIVRTFEWVLKLWDVLTKIPFIGPLLKVIGHFASLLGWILLIIDAMKAAMWVFKNWEEIPDIIAKKWVEFKKWMISLWEEIKSGIGEKVEGLKNNVTAVWESLTDWLGEKWNDIKATAGITWEGISNTITGWWDNIHTKTTEVWESVTGWLGEKWESIKTAAVEKWEGIGATIFDWWNNINTKTTEVWGSIAKWLGTTWETLKTTVGTTWEEISNTIAGWWNQINTNTTEVWNTIVSWLNTTWESIKTTAITKWNEIASGLKKTWNGIKSTAKDIWNEVKELIKGTINGIIDIINRFIQAFNKIRIEVPRVNIPGVGPVGGFSVGVPKIMEIPKLARGGIIDEPTIAMIGEAGKEAVVPLENTSFVNTMASAVGTAVLAAMQMANNNQRSGFSESKDIVVEIDGVKLIRILLPKLDAELQRMGGRSILRPT
jgi:hypothetical protein